MTRVQVGRAGNRGWIFGRGWYSVFYSVRTGSGTDPASSSVSRDCTLLGIKWRWRGVTQTFRSTLRLAAWIVGRLSVVVINWAQGAASVLVVPLFPHSSSHTVHVTVGADNHMKKFASENFWDFWKGTGAAGGNLESRRTFCPWNFFKQPHWQTDGLGLLESHLRTSAFCCYWRVAFNHLFSNLSLFWNIPKVPTSYPSGIKCRLP